jgi:hypothetical protein
LDLEDTAGRYEKSTSIAEAATDYSLTSQEVSILTHAEFIALALTTPALKQQFASPEEFGPTAIELTGMKGTALGVIIAFLVKHEYAARDDNRYGYELTAEGEKFLQDGIIAARK